MENASKSDMNYRELYDLGVQELQTAGVAEAKLDAKLLLEEVCGTDRNTLLVHPERSVSENEKESYVNYIKRRSERIPLQQILGKQEFMGIEFYVNQNTLIPRQDTEILTEEALKNIHDGMRILDICTGSGCILISLLKYSNDCVGVGIDCSEAALEAAKRNAEAVLKDKGQYVFYCGDLFEALKDTSFGDGRADENAASDSRINKKTDKFDMIVSNPPYIRSDVIPTLEPEVSEHEPLLALDGKEDGLHFYRRIIAEAGSYLVRGGMLFFEIGHDQAEAVTKLMKENGYADVQVVKDYAGHNRVVYGTYAV